MSEDRCATCSAPIGDGHRVDMLNAAGEVVKTYCGPCYDERGKSEWRRSGRLTTNLMLDALMSRSPRSKGHGDPTLEDIAIDVDDVRAAATRFSAEVWSAGLGERVRKDEARGMRADFGTSSILTYCLAGRVMVTLEAEGGATVTVLGEDDNPARGVGLHGIGGTAGEAIALLNGAREAWAAGTLKPKRDDKVGIPC